MKRKRLEEHQNNNDMGEAIETFKVFAEYAKGELFSYANSDACSYYSEQKLLFFFFPLLNTLLQNVQCFHLLSS